MRRKKADTIYMSWIIYGGIIAIIVFLIFFVLDVCVINKDRPIITVADSLSYFGSIIGAILGLGGVILTIQYTQRTTETQRKEYIREKKTDNALSVCPLLQIRFKEVEINGKYNIDVIEKSVENSDPQWENFTFQVLNMGKGVAQNLRIYAQHVPNRQDFVQISDPELQYCPLFVPYINVNEDMNFWVTLYYNYQDIAERELLMRINLEYTDIFLNSYTEFYDFHFNIIRLPVSAPKYHGFLVPFKVSFGGKELISKIVKDRNGETLDMGIELKKL